MKKILLLTTAVLLFTGNANAVCNPNLPACQCSYPKMKNGIIGCSESYCGDEKCMPDGSCCPTDNYCESSEKGKECCSDGQTCDTTKGCVTRDLEALCAAAKGKIRSINTGKKVCISDQAYLGNEAETYCLKNGMKLPDVDEICSGWDGSTNWSYSCSEWVNVWNGSSLIFLWVVPEEFIFVTSNEDNAYIGRAMPEADCLVVCD